MPFISLNSLGFHCNALISQRLLPDAEDERRDDGADDDRQHEQQRVVGESGYEDAAVRCRNVDMP
ncbi:hypothetical protein D3C73_1253730 [compost metagenome]